MINPSTIDLKSLPWLPLDEKTAFPKRSAIYFAIDSLGNVQYIGRAKNVRSRWGSHHKYSELSEMGNIKIAYLFVDLPELLPQIETALIEYFNPPLNTVKVGVSVPSIDLIARSRKTRTIRFLTEVAKAVDRYAEDEMISANLAVNKLLLAKLTEIGYLKSGSIGEEE